MIIIPWKLPYGQRTPVVPGFPPSEFGKGYAGAKGRLFATSEYTHQIRSAGDIANAIRYSSPQERRELYAVLRELGGIDSLFPVQEGNPKADILQD